MTVLKSILTKAAAAYNSACDVKLKKISEHGDYNLGAGIYRDPVTTEHVVFFVDGGEYLSKADYYTKCGLTDAEGTIDHFLNPHKGELQDTGVDPDARDAQAKVDTPPLVRNAAPRGFKRHPNPLMQGLLMRVTG